MTPLIDPDELVDSHQVALILNLSSRGGVAVYQRRYRDFPSPRVERGRCLLWLRSDVEQWADRRIHERRLERDPAYKAGFVAGPVEATAEANPHSPGTEEHHSWNEGWRRGSATLGVDVEGMAADIERRAAKR